MASRTQILITAGLAAATAWSGLFALAAVTGLGGRHTTLGEDAGLVPPLPEVNLEQAVSRLEGQGFYAEIGDRPLFNFDRRPLPPVQSQAAQTQDDAPPPPVNLDVVLTSIIKSSDRQIAIVLHPSSNKSQTLNVGEHLDGDMNIWRLVELQPRAAVFEGPGGRKLLEQRVFDGTGGQPPTPIDAPAAPAVAAVEAVEGESQGAAADTPEARAEMIRRRIEERRRQMREEAERARQ